MTEYNPAQVSKFFGDGGQIVGRGSTAEEAVDIFEALCKNAERIHAAATGFDNVFGIKQEVNKAQAAVQSSGQTSSGPARAGAGTCKHGLPWNDLAGQVGKNGEPYKYRFYCAAKVDNWKDRCKPQDEM